MLLFFPEDPSTGQKYVGVNGVTYTWTGDRWSSASAIEAGTAEFYVDGGDAEFEYNENRDGLLDGGTAVRKQKNDNKN